jgi:CBS-domain-containing membrane protein
MSTTATGNTKTLTHSARQSHAPGEPMAHPPLHMQAETAEELMVSNPISVRAEADLAEATLLFTTKGIAAAPVIDEAGRPIGVISRSDLLIHQAEQARSTTSRSAASAEEPGADESPLGSKSTVADLMTPAVFAVAPQTPVRQVISDMIGLHVHRLFVVDAAGVLIGVITTMDVLKQLKPGE